jgi:hypothetical protein
MLLMLRLLQKLSRIRLLLVLRQSGAWSRRARREHLMKLQLWRRLLPLLRLLLVLLWQRSVTHRSGRCREWRVLRVVLLQLRHYRTRRRAMIPTTTTARRNRNEVLLLLLLHWCLLVHNLGLLVRLNLIHLLLLVTHRQQLKGILLLIVAMDTGQRLLYKGRAAA